MTDLPMLVVLAWLVCGLARRLLRAPSAPGPVRRGSILPERRAAIPSAHVARVFRRER